MNARTKAAAVIASTAGAKRSLRSTVCRGPERLPFEAVSPSTVAAAVDIERKDRFREVQHWIPVPSHMARALGGWALGTAANGSPTRSPTMRSLSSCPRIADAADTALGEPTAFLVYLDQPAEPDRVLVTILFSDIVGSTRRAIEMGDRLWSSTLARYQMLVRHELWRYHGREVDTAGDGLFAVFDGPVRAIRCAVQMMSVAHVLELDIRAGLHAGECEMLGERFVGIAVHIGARVAGIAKPGEVVVSSTVKDLVTGSGLHFNDRGLHALAGLAERWHLFTVDQTSVWPCDESARRALARRQRPAASS